MEQIDGGQRVAAAAHSLDRDGGQVHVFLPAQLWSATTGGRHGKLRIYNAGFAIWVSDDLDDRGRPTSAAVWRVDELAKKRARFGGRVDAGEGYNLLLGKGSKARTTVAVARQLTTMLKDVFALTDDIGREDGG